MCSLCSSWNEVEFRSEIMVHFIGRKHLNKPGVLDISKHAGLFRLRLNSTHDS